MNIQTIVILFFTCILEAFPISSSTHIDYLKKMFIYEHDIDFLSSLEFIMHGLIFLVIAIYFFNRWFFLLYHVRRSWKIIETLFYLGFITELITSIGCVIFWLKPIISIPQYLGFAITTGALFSLRFLPRQSSNVWNYRNAITLGIAQGAAFLPGISRFGITFVLLRWVGIAPRRAFEISFLIEVPILLAVCCKGWFDFYALQTFPAFSMLYLYLMSFTFLITYCCFWIIDCMIQANLFWLFSCYTLVLTILFWL